MDAAVTDGPETVARSSTANEAFAAIVSQALHEARATLAAAGAGDVEGIHELRVALRRLRAALDLFAPLLPSAPRRALSRDLRQLGKCVGAARDWDVCATETLERARPSRDVQHHATLRRRADTQRAAAQAEARERLARAETAALFDRVADFPSLADRAPPRSDPWSLHQPVTNLAPRLIRRLYRRTGRRGRHPRRADNERLHALRKSIKTLRYGIEFLAPLYDHDVCAEYLESARKAQGRLGRANDAHGIPRLTQALTDDHATTQGLLDWARRDHRKTRRKAIRAWQRLRRQEAFWRDPARLNATSGNASAARRRDAGEPS